MSSLAAFVSDFSNMLSNIVDENASLSRAPAIMTSNPPICRYFQRGICHYGNLCRFSHALTGGEGNNNCNSNETEPLNPTTSTKNNNKITTESLNARPSTSRQNWINAPVFVPKNHRSTYAPEEPTPDNSTNEGATAMCPMNNDIQKSWADVVGGGNVAQRTNIVEGADAEAMLEMECPFEGPCPYGAYCAYGIHMELCKMCDQFCLHPSDQNQRRKHNQDCLQQHEQAMELSFAIARSKDKTCGICFDTIMEKAGREKRFGILPNCNHIFCLECIRKWRQAKQFEHKITRSCPECRVSSDFVCPSAFWVETKEEKDKLLNDYRLALGVKDCKYFKKGSGKCPFGNKCFYKHALPNGDLVDVGCPKRARKLHRGSNDFIDLLDIYLWEFVEQRDYHWLDFLSGTSDDSDDSDFSEE
ncbi:probable E3 ubiquitin-protein ligase makorin-1 [Zeugodacus cucurbitae]|uniref:RING-type E3 ubiquitin transferase n=1 Tax=Zeugodacus cucurbitae TaxID=28588 RepID=A0A0A1WKA1_ZEUCU|nr:probable E3 ubiquitin-protein ligase makorin-1 [Zeugodacus cucurbitae]XP_011196726.1 probable E3 ubiquitin-protein ligase makorin-1 [Zeugodacus cucurbitae]XP_028900637.1 probable E3 ubiquitin-protein ligase makorin-1 [Zeugodacus cucurbitae]XP_054085354.1 probable E3 ubiquitin-protein ligase makorin-1 [Zeugodacus cucurbitae]XP_054085355.1 probable E3 ubiquitin-protein ligase makorin-1 [Zeugodacus cucurbitae]